MSKILVVFGATGQQGGSVVNYVLNDPELSKQFKIRAVTRDPSKPAAQTLQQQGVDIVKGDVDDKESIKYALQDAHTVFGVTTTSYDEHLYSREFAQGKALADAAVAAGVQYFIFSSLPHAGKLSNGKHPGVESFNVKADIEEYIRSLPIKSAFFAPGLFMQNYSRHAAPQPQGDETYALLNIISPQTLLPLIDTPGDTGKYVGAILAEPDKYEGTVFNASTELLTFEEMAEVISKSTGKTVKYKQISAEAYASSMPADLGKYLTRMQLYIQDCGYFGPQTRELVEWSVKNARGKLTTFEEYFQKNPLHLQ
ncbi:hypothetical protein BX616_009289 [Lobosporangium transversale]|uniref:NmrA-like domain-containing protein n=1 Tax=Lobosporangium transversale TaxID=64571 RepID=A0A1Y2H028_9FUNG|nr:hypothetical protein BCR41DRAFT_379853 [Lobosporangium transversale]KAF9913936.1 hypothetical protein BX616_009289 [Lobosporangium transversale]ORZ27920.1 hypothetical protein BCR41DRAFT_379853 [Lobosporangium transversale]|eukprot:XP_021885623.1 hypothetical protein BCR41DRAFT_379853 [Lobosporangium transversale]